MVYCGSEKPPRSRFKGTYEFGLIPQLLFPLDGSLLLVYMIKLVLHHLEALPKEQQLLIM